MSQKRDEYMDRVVEPWLMWGVCSRILDRVVHNPPWKDEQNLQKVEQLETLCQMVAELWPRWPSLREGGLQERPGQSGAATGRALRRLQAKRWPTGARFHTVPLTNSAAADALTPFACGDPRIATMHCTLSASISTDTPTLQRLL